MEKIAIHGVIAEMFSLDAALGKYRQQYTAENVDNFLRDNANSLSNKIIAMVRQEFEDHIAINNLEEQSVDTSINVIESEKLCTNDVNKAITTGNISEDDQLLSENKSSEILNQTVVSEIPPVSVDSTQLTTQMLTELPSTESGATPIQAPKESQENLKQPDAPGGPVPRKFIFKLKGGKLQSSVPYEGRIEFSEGLPGVTPHISKVEMQPDMGLQFDESDPARIFGTPTVGGDITLLIKYSLDAQGVNPVELAYSITEFVNHDPKTLWKNLPSDRKDPHWKSDFDSFFTEAADRKIVAASQRGRSHAHEGKFRDDDFLIQVTDTGWHILAVADGAGSAIKSRRGSQIAVSTAINTILELLAGEEGSKLEMSVANWHGGDVTKEQVVAIGLYPILGIAAFKACKAIEAEANALSIAVKEFSTTLLVTVYKKMPYGNFFATYWVGDGGVGICLNDGTPKLLGKVDSGEYAGQTRFLDNKVMTTDEITNRLHFEVVDDFRALVAMTDGITDPWFMTDNNLESQEYWEKLWSEVEPALKSDDPAASLLAWLDFWSPGNHDDRTIAILW